VIDIELINRKLVLIGQDLEGLDELSGKPESEYMANRVYEAAAERYLERMIGRMIDINFHILVESGQAPPSDYYQSFIKLVELGVYSPEFAKTIAGSAGLRNRIAHEYDEIDAKQVYAAIGSAKADVPKYIRCIEEFLKKS
jgi:uncharacterized protein YutE (UPF0331/DUF86 family)